MGSILGLRLERPRTLTASRAVRGLRPPHVSEKGELPMLILSEDRLLIEDDGLDGLAAGTRRRFEAVCAIKHPVGIYAALLHHPDRRSFLSRLQQRDVLRDAPVSRPCI